MVNVDRILASYRRMLEEVGEDVTVRRYTGSGTDRPKVDVTCSARVVGYSPDELTGVIQQGDRLSSCSRMTISRSRRPIVRRNR